MGEWDELDNFLDIFEALVLTFDEVIFKGEVRGFGGPDCKDERSFGPLEPDLCEVKESVVIILMV